MTLLAAVRRNACRFVSGSGRPPSLAVARATKAVDAAHAHACLAWGNLFARGAPSMAGAESELCLAQYFYGMATPINAEFEIAKEAKDMVKDVLQDFPFDIKEKHNCMDLILTRRYGDEQIEVVISAPFPARAMPECNWAESADQSSEGEAKSVLALQVTVTKGGSLSMFTCTASQVDVRVNTMYMRMTVGEEEKEEYSLSFEGPNSSEILHQLVHKYLELRGVTMMTASFLHNLLSNKDVFVSILWLEMLKGFIKQSPSK